MPRDDTLRTAGDFVRAKELTPKDIKALFDGRTTLPLRDGYALTLPAWKGFTPHVQEVIRSTLLQAKVTNAE